MPQWDLLMKYRFSCEIPKSCYTCILPRLKKNEKYSPYLPRGKKMHVSCHPKEGVAKKALQYFGIFGYLKAAPTRVFSTRRG